MCPTVSFWPGYSHTQDIIHAGRPNEGFVAYGGWRWTDLDIPAGARIIEAYVELNQNNWGWEVETQLALENSGSPATFSGEDTPADRWQNRTGSSVNWTWDRQEPATTGPTPLTSVTLYRNSLTGMVTWTQSR